MLFWGAAEYIFVLPVLLSVNSSKPPKNHDSICPISRGIRVESSRLSSLLIIYIDIHVLLDRTKKPDQRGLSID